MALTSIALSLISLLLIWLILPIFVLPPLAFYLGWRSHRVNQLANPTPSAWEDFRSVLPMGIAALAFLLGVYWIHTGYRV